MQWLLLCDWNFVCEGNLHDSYISRVSGACLTKDYDVTIQWYRNSHAKSGDSEMHMLRYMGSQLCVQFRKAPLKFNKKSACLLRYFMVKKCHRVFSFHVPISQWCWLLRMGPDFGQKGSRVQLVAYKSLPSHDDITQVTDSFARGVWRIGDKWNVKYMFAP